MAGQNPALVVRVAATIEELRANLAAGKNQIETTTAAMGKLAASFSGDRLIQSAQNVTAAVNAIGGASKLTDAEAARVNATLERALEKYAALGREAPAGMQKLADETRNAEKASSGLTDMVKELALGFAAMFTARAAFDFVQRTIEDASALKDLSTQTHINVEDLQLLAGAMSEFGVDSETLGKALYKLSHGIAGGDESVANGLHLMGLSLKDVEGLQGKELFLKIEAGLATLQGGLRDTAAAELFGGKLGAAMAGASEGIEGALETWQRLNHVASTESVDAMDQFGESIKRAQTNLASIAANMIGPVAQGFNVLNGAADQGASKWSIFWASTKDALFAMSGFGTGTENLTRLLDEQNKKAEANAAAHRATAAAHGQVTAAIDRRTAAEKFMAALEADAAVTLTASQLTNLAHLKEIGALTAKNAEGIGVNAAQFEKYKAGIEAAKKATEELDAITMTGFTTRAKLLQDETMARLKNYSFEGQIAALHALDQAEHDLARTTFNSISSGKDRATVVADTVKAHIELLKQEATAQQQHMAVVNAAILAEFNAQTALNKAMGLDAAGNIEIQRRAADRLTTALDELHRRKVEGIDQTKQEELLMQQFTQGLHDEATAADAAAAAMYEGNKKVAASSEEAARKTDAGYSIAFANAGGGFAAFKGAVLQGNAEMVESAFGVASAYAAVLFGNAPRGVSFTGYRQPTAADVEAASRAAGRQAGGPVAPHQAYVVGERGPEWFVPDRAGTIVPRGADGVTIHAPITINGSVLSDEGKIGNAVSQALLTTLLRLGIRLPARS